MKQCLFLISFYVGFCLLEHKQIIVFIFLLLLFYNALTFVRVFGSNVKLVLEGVLFLSTCCKGRIGLFFVFPFNCMTSSELFLIFFSYYVHIKIISIPNYIQNVLSIIIDYIELYFLLSNLGSPWYP